MPKRTKPVQRDEVRFRPYFGAPCIETMPASAMRKNSDGTVEPIAALSAPLLRLLDQQGREDWRGYVAEGLSLRDDPPAPATVGLPYGRRHCRHCGRSFYYTERATQTLYCSDKCVAAVHREAMVPIVEARSKARAVARANRKCAACGKPIKAKRSTMRFCSVNCRVAAHRDAKD
jgi:endogenous inhibitor of DNA gyrase (YacG/DUF329 family)